MKPIAITISALACVLLAACAENTVPRLAPIEPMAAANTFAITDVECRAAPGVSMSGEDIRRNQRLTQATLKTIRTSSGAQTTPRKTPLKLRVLFRSYHRGTDSIVKIVPLLGRIQLSADFVFIDGAGQTVGVYRAYNGVLMGSALNSVFDVEAGLQHGVSEFVQSAGLDVALRKP